MRKTDAGNWAVFESQARGKHEKGPTTDPTQTTKGRSDYRARGSKNTGKNAQNRADTPLISTELPPGQPHRPKPARTSVFRSCCRTEEPVKTMQTGQKQHSTPKEGTEACKTNTHTQPTTTQTNHHHTHTKRRHTSPQEQAEKEGTTNTTWSHTCPHQWPAQPHDPTTTTTMSTHNPTKNTL